MKHPVDDASAALYINEPRKKGASVHYSAPILLLRRGLKG